MLADLLNEFRIAVALANRKSHERRLSRDRSIKLRIVNLRRLERAGSKGALFISSRTRYNGRHFMREFFFTAAAWTAPVGYTVVCVCMCVSVCVCVCVCVCLCVCACGHVRRCHVTSKFSRPFWSMIHLFRMGWIGVGGGATHTKSSSTF